MEEFLQATQSEVKTCPKKMRRFITHLAGAVGRTEEKARQKEEIKGRIERIKQLSLNKRSTKQEIEYELGSFEDAVSEIIKDEEKILEEQRKGTKEVTQLREMVELLSRKIVMLGGDYGAEIDNKDKKILELRESLAAANMKISESGEGRAEKIRKIEEKVKGKSFAPETHEELHSRLKELEKKHKELKRNGNYPKAQLDRLQKIINSHKESLLEIME